MEREGLGLRYEAPELRVYGTIAGLTRGSGGSCPDGAGRNVNQHGGGLDNKPGDPGMCGPSN